VSDDGIVKICWIFSVVVTKALVSTPSSGAGAGAGASASSTLVTPSTATRSPAEEAKRKKRLAELKPHFVFITDEFNHRKTVRHRAFSKFMNGNGTTIEAEIQEGNVFVESQYVADDWIFHEAFTVKIGDSEESAEGRGQREVIDGVCETVSPNSNSSERVAMFIASAGTQPVRVRLHGKFDKDYTLRPAHQKAIAETVEYYDLTKDE
jgi:hypothetical protein